MKLNRVSYFSLATLLVSISNIGSYYYADAEAIKYFVGAYFTMHIAKGFAFPIWNEIERLKKKTNLTLLAKLIVFYMISSIVLSKWLTYFSVVIAFLISSSIILKLKGRVYLSELIIQLIPTITLILLPPLSENFFGMSSLMLMHYALCIIWLLLALVTIRYLIDNIDFTLRSIVSSFASMLDEYFVVNINAETFYAYKVVKTLFGFLAKIQYVFNLKNYADYYEKGEFERSLRIKIFQRNWHRFWLLSSVISFFVCTMLLINNKEGELITIGVVFLFSAKFVGGWVGSKFYLISKRKEIIYYNVFLLVSYIAIIYLTGENYHLSFIYLGVINVLFNVYLYRKLENGFF